MELQVCVCGAFRIFCLSVEGWWWTRLQIWTKLCEYGLPLYLASFLPPILQLCFILVFH